MSSYIGDQDVLSAKSFSDISDYSLRFHRTDVVICVFCKGFIESFPYFKDAFRFRAVIGIQFIDYSVEGVRDITYHLYIALIIFIYMGRRRRNMYYLRIVVLVPSERGELHQVVSYSDNEVGVYQQLVGVVILRDTHSHHGVLVVVRDYALCHHSIDDRYFEILGKTCQSLGCMDTHRLAACQDHRVRSFPDESGCLGYRAVHGLFLERDLALEGSLRSREFHLGNVHREVYMTCSRTLAFCVFESDPYDLVYGVRSHDHLRSLGDRFEKFRQIHVLM